MIQIFGYLKIGLSWGLSVGLITAGKSVQQEPGLSWICCWVGHSSRWAKVWLPRSWWTGKKWKSRQTSFEQQSGFLMRNSRLVGTELASRVRIQKGGRASRNCKERFEEFTKFLAFVISECWIYLWFKTQVNSCTYSVRSDMGQTTIKSGSHVIISIFPHLNTRWMLFYLYSHFKVSLNYYVNILDFRKALVNVGEEALYYLTVFPSFQSRHIMVCNNISYFYTD